MLQVKFIFIPYAHMHACSSKWRDAMPLSRKNSSRSLATRETTREALDEDKYYLRVHACDPSRPALLFCGCSGQGSACAITEKFFLL